MAKIAANAYGRIVTIYICRNFEEIVSGRDKYCLKILSNIDYRKGIVNIPNYPYLVEELCESAPYTRIDIDRFLFPGKYMAILTVQGKKEEYTTYFELKELEPFHTPPGKCGVVLYHVTHKENLEKIMREGLLPGAETGLCEYGIEHNLTDMTERDRCKEYIFLTESFAIAEGFARTGKLDLILIICVPSEKVFITKDKNIHEYRQEHADLCDSLPYEVMIKDIIGPEYIIDCLEIDKHSLRSPYTGLYSIMRCKTRYTWK